MGAQLTPHTPAEAAPGDRKDGSADRSSRPADETGREQRAGNAPSLEMDDDEPALPRMPRQYPEPTD